MPPEMPVIYENPRFDAATPTLRPVFDRAMRAGLVLMLEWGTLTLIESAPPYLKWATVVIAILGLSVHELWPWLRMRDKRWYPALMGGLILAFVGICGYAVLTEPQSHHIASVTPVQPTRPTPPPAPPVDRRKNPLDDGAAKWGVVSGLHSALATNNLSKCDLSIVRYQLPYAEELSDRIKEIFAVLDWTPKESFSTTQQPRGLTIKSSDHTSEFNRCGAQFRAAFVNSTTWKGGTWNLNQTYFPHSADCANCVELDIGNDPDQ